ncbi:MAG: sn-glycerol-3-phosphate ABC transporter ATP-binding protein UgpC [Candidatus Saelkia tenebricola]|nr:sn-glycerol-3-phosphate ABC transporter ATP-binding protein UgpC [Candidatus Saelkia tenebricola]
MPQVSLTNVKKIYSGEVLAVDNFSIEIEHGEFTVILGPSGCGKSTTLRMVAGLEEVTSGEIYIGDKLVNDVPSKDRNIAMVFQNYALYPHMTVYENMAFGLKLRKYPKNEINKRVNDAAEILSLKRLLKRRPKELSGGEKQRVAVGRAIVRKPLVFLFDEPLSNLDAKLRVQMRIELNKLHKRLQSTMIYVTHDQIEAMTLGERIVVMKDGQIQQIADPHTLYNKPVNKFVAGFIGTPPMNFLNGKIIKKDSKFYFDSGSLKVRIVDDMVAYIKDYLWKEIVFGIRPEDIYDKLFVSEAPPENIVHVNVDVVEPMGSEVYLYLNSGDSSFIAKVAGQEQVEPGQDLEVVFDMSRIHFFDKDTEKAII